MYTLIFRYLLILGISFSFAQGPVPTGGFNPEESASLKSSNKNDKTFWQNTLAGYKSFRDQAKMLVKNLSAVSDLVWTFEANLRKWEKISRTVKYLMHNNPINPNSFIGTIENLEEQFFQPMDDLLWYKIPDARWHGRLLADRRRLMVEGWQEQYGMLFPGAREHATGTMRAVGLPTPLLGSKASNNERAHSLRVSQIAKVGSAGEGRRSNLKSYSANLEASYSNMVHTFTQCGAKNSGQSCSDPSIYTDMSNSNAHNNAMSTIMDQSQVSERTQLYSTMLLQAVRDFGNESDHLVGMHLPLTILSRELEDINQFYGTVKGRTVRDMRFYDDENEFDVNSLTEDN